MANEILYILIAVLAVLVFIIFVYVYAMNLRNRANEKLLELSVVSGKKRDMVPLLAETARQYISNLKEKKFIDEVLRVRKSFYANSGDENMAELDFAIKRLIDFGVKNRRMSHDLNFLELKNDFFKNHEAIHHTAVEYNIVAAKYNRLAIAGKISLFRI